VTALHKSHGGAAAGLIYTVEAKSWERLHTAVAEQVELYEALCTGADA
jgi:hypothetical protein